MRRVLLPDAAVVIGILEERLVVESGGRYEIER
jgi:hypothetical protein